MALSNLPIPEPDKQPRKGFPWTEESSFAAHDESVQLPRITIITPSYNQGQYLEETIRSIVLQNYPNLEFIIVDGGSKDNSVEIIKKYEPWITYWVSEKDKGTYDAINKGLEKMTGDYWCVVNSDDILLQDALLKVVRFLIKNPETDWLTGDIYSINEHSAPKHTFNVTIPETRIANLSFLTGCWIRHPATFLSKKVYADIGAFAAIDMLDYDYWIKLEIKKYFPAIINEPIAALRYHSDCKSIDYEKAIKQNMKLLGSYISSTFSQNIQASQEIAQKIEELENTYFQTAIKRNIFYGNITEAFALWKQLLAKRPKLLTERWFIGLFTRLFTKKVKEEEFNPFVFLRQ